MYEQWKELARESGVMDGNGIQGITVRQVPGMDMDDVVLCPASDADARIAQMGTSRTARRLNAERMFMARALKHDAETALAILVRAVIGRWVHSRGRIGIDDVHERRAWTLLENHMAAMGQSVAMEVTAGRQQIADTHIKAPISHSGPDDVIRKAVAQLAKQIGGRHVIVMGKSPLAV